MEPTTAMILAAIQLFNKALELYPQIKAGMTSEDQAEVDAALESVSAKRNAIADRLRATPDQPE